MIFVIGVITLCMCSVSFVFWSEIRHLFLIITLFRCENEDFRQLHREIALLHYVYLPDVIPYMPHCHHCQLGIEITYGPMHSCLNCLGIKQWVKPDVQNLFNHKLLGELFLGDWKKEPFVCHEVTIFVITICTFLCCVVYPVWGFVETLQIK